MAFRARRGDYIKAQNGRFYYRRAIPAAHREAFGGKTEWFIALTGQNDTERKREAQALAAKHDRQLAYGPIEAVSVPADAGAAVFDLAPPDLPPDAPAPSPLWFHRQGKLYEITKFAITDDPTQRRALEAKGFFVVGQEEAKHQLESQAQIRAFEEAPTYEAAEIADLKAERAAKVIEDVARVSGGHTVLSVLPLWRDHRKQAPATWKKHVQYVNDFAALHGDLPLVAVTKRHVVEFVESAQKLQHNNAPLSPASISKRVDSIRALLAYAVATDLLQVNPATGVKAPKDTRPKTARSWKSLTLDEVKALVAVSTKIWDTRRNSRQPGRKEDLMTALQALIWTGARPEEICQLRREDVDMVRLLIRITNDASEDESRPRMMKNEHSIREVPIHPTLQPILEAHLRRHNSPLAFPSFEPLPTPGEIDAAQKTGRPLEIKGRYARPLTREWTDTLREHIAPNEPRKVLYSLRHSWAAESRRSGMPEHVRNALMGHADDNPHAGRYGGDADWLAEKARHVAAMCCA